MKRNIFLSLLLVFILSGISYAEDKGTTSRDEALNYLAEVKEVPAETVANTLEQEAVDTAVSGEVTKAINGIREQKRKDAQSYNPTDDEIATYIKIQKERFLARKAEAERRAAEVQASTAAGTTLFNK